MNTFEHDWPELYCGLVDGSISIIQVHDQLVDHDYCVPDFILYWYEITTLGTDYSDLLHRAVKIRNRMSSLQTHDYFHVFSVRITTVYEEHVSELLSELYMSFKVMDTNDINTLLESLNVSEGLRSMVTDMITEFSDSDSDTFMRDLLLVIIAVLIVILIGTYVYYRFRCHIVIQP